VLGARALRFGMKNYPQNLNTQSSQHGDCLPRRDTHGRTKRAKRLLRIPQRIELVLQGESLLNDATALWIYRAAVLGFQ
jgi:hypothetical protein